MGTAKEPERTKSKSYSIQKVQTPPPPPELLSRPPHLISLKILLHGQKLCHEFTDSSMIRIFFSENTAAFSLSILDDCYDVLPQVLCERRKQKGYCSVEGWEDYLRENCAYTCRFCGK